MSLDTPPQPIDILPSNLSQENEPNISFGRIVFFVILGLLAWAVFFGLIFLWHPWAK